MYNSFSDIQCVMVTGYLLNSILYLIGWFFVVHSAAQGFAWEGSLVASIIVVFHLFRSEHPISEFCLIAFALVAGFFIESFFVYCDILSFASPNVKWTYLAPFWLAGLYAVFTTTINYSLARFGSSFMVAAVFGFAGSICSYYAGHKLGAVDFLMPKAGSLIVIGSVWFFFLPTLFKVNQAIINFRNHHVH